MNNPKTTHFSGNRKYLAEFNYLFLVHCPRCDKCARVEPHPTENAPKAGTTPYRKLMFTPRRLTCEYCGYVKDWEGNQTSQPEGHDWYFGCPLWLQGPCCGETLWAFNPQHLQFIEDFVRAGIRETHINATLASRLPEWMKLGKNREDVLKGIAKVRQLLVAD